MEMRRSFRRHYAAHTVDAARVSVSVRAILPQSVRGAPRPHGRVVTVHDRAVNVQFGDRLVTIARAEIGALPNGVTVDDPIASADREIMPGMTATWDGRAIDIGGVVLRVVLSGARDWSPLLAPADHLPLDLAARRAIVTAAARAAGRNGLDGIACVRSAADALAVAVSAGSDDAIEERGRCLIGLGPGLTPSGDDLLVALGATLTALRHPAARRVSGAWSKAAFGRTTLVADVFHRHSAAGEYAERLHVLLDAVLSGPHRAIPAAVRRAAAWGATSGLDAVAGLEIGLAARLSRPGSV